MWIRRGRSRPAATYAVRIEEDVSSRVHGRSIPASLSYEQRIRLALADGSGVEGDVPGA
jgi:hypothetical protein